MQRLSGVSLSVLSDRPQKFHCDQDGAGGAGVGKSPLCVLQ